MTDDGVVEVSVQRRDAGAGTRRLLPHPNARRRRGGRRVGRDRPAEPPGVHVDWTHDLAVPPGTTRRHHAARGEWRNARSAAPPPPARSGAARSPPQGVGALPRPTRCPDPGWRSRPGPEHLTTSRQPRAAAGNAVARSAVCRPPGLSAAAGVLSVSSGGSVACNSRMVISAVFGAGKPTEVSTSSNSSLAQRARTRSSDSHTPMMYKAPSPIAQWWRSSPALDAPPRLMISACALSYACRNWSTSPSKRAMSMIAIPCLQTRHGHEPTVADCRRLSQALAGARAGFRCIAVRVCCRDGRRSGRIPRFQDAAANLVAGLTSPTPSWKEEAL